MTERNSRDDEEDIRREISRYDEDNKSDISNFDYQPEQTFKGANKVNSQPRERPKGANKT